jgi:hypothetical protein
MDFTLKFGKYKGVNFSSTPKSYQTWLLKQEWFKRPDMESNSPSWQISHLSRQLKGWDGYSKRGMAIYDAIFEAEKAEDDLYYNSEDQCSPRYDGSW